MAVFSMSWNVALARCIRIEMVTFWMPPFTRFGRLDLFWSSRFYRVRLGQFLVAFVQRRLSWFNSFDLYTVSRF